ncbi:hypothetical protein [Paraburkholderia lycopersici]|uniref:hypothetical protein n=1 Tax=Paraburkholderia lycopersici TaxID=416944 RepID=UPI001161204D|nr:hypothetical protein [Paraburkholderia lycopersici]
MNVKMIAKVVAQVAKAGKPGMYAISRSAVPSHPFFVFSAASGNTRRTPSVFWFLPSSREVVAVLLMRFIRTLAELVIQARHCKCRINHARVCHRIMPVGACDRFRRRKASDIYGGFRFVPGLPSSVELKSVSCPHGRSADAGSCARYAQGMPACRTYRRRSTQFGR